MATPNRHCELQKSPLFIEFPVSSLDILKVLSAENQFYNYIIHFAVTSPTLGLNCRGRPHHSPLIHFLSIALLNHVILSLFAELSLKLIRRQ